MQGTFIRDNHAISTSSGTGDVPELHIKMSTFSGGG
jgi:hypothetical protein